PRVPHAHVQLGAVVIGDAPLGRVGVEAGDAVVKISAEGYRDDVRHVTIAPVREQSLACNLLTKSTSGVVVVDAAPLGTLISIDERFVGTSHVELPLAAGPHVVVAKREGYDKASMPIVLAVGESRRLTIPLEKTPVPITARWWFWGGIGAVLIAGG